MPVLIYWVERAILVPAESSERWAEAAFRYPSTPWLSYTLLHYIPGFMPALTCCLKASLTKDVTRCCIMLQTRFFPINLLEKGHIISCKLQYQQQLQQGIPCFSYQLWKKFFLCFKSNTRQLKLKSHIPCDMWIVRNYCLSIWHDSCLCRLLKFIDASYCSDCY